MDFAKTQLESGDISPHKKSLSLEARHSKAIESARKISLNLKPSIFIPKLPQKSLKFPWISSAKPPKILPFPAKPYIHNTTVLKRTKLIENPKLNGTLQRVRRKLQSNRKKSDTANKSKPRKIEEYRKHLRKANINGIKTKMKPSEQPIKNSNMDKNVAKDDGIEDTLRDMGLEVSVTENIEIVTLSTDKIGEIVQNPNSKQTHENARSSQGNPKDSEDTEVIDLDSSADPLDISMVDLCDEDAEEANPKDGETSKDERSAEIIDLVSSEDPENATEEQVQTPALEIRHKNMEVMLPISSSAAMEDHANVKESCKPADPSEIIDLSSAEDQINPTAKELTPMENVSNNTELTSSFPNLSHSETIDLASSEDQMSPPTRSRSPTDTLATSDDLSHSETIDLASSEDQMNPSRKERRTSMEYIGNNADMRCSPPKDDTPLRYDLCHSETIDLASSEDQITRTRVETELRTPLNNPVNNYPPPSPAPSDISQNIYNYNESLNELREFQELLKPFNNTHFTSPIDEAIFRDLRGIQDSVNDFAIFLHKTYMDMEEFELEQSNIYNKFAATNQQEIEVPSEVVVKIDVPEMPRQIITFRATEIMQCTLENFGNSHTTDPLHPKTGTEILAAALRNEANPEPRDLSNHCQNSTTEDLNNSQVQQRYEVIANAQGLSNQSHVHANNPQIRSAKNVHPAYRNEIPATCQTVAPKAYNSPVSQYQRQDHSHTLQIPITTNAGGLHRRERVSTECQATLPLPSNPSVQSSCQPQVPVCREPPTSYYPPIHTYQLLSGANIPSSVNSEMPTSSQSSPTSNNRPIQAHQIQVSNQSPQIFSSTNIPPTISHNSPVPAYHIQVPNFSRQIQQIAMNQPTSQAVSRHDNSLRPTYQADYSPQFHSSPQMRHNPQLHPAHESQFSRSQNSPAAEHNLQSAQSVCNPQPQTYISQAGRNHPHLPNPVPQNQEPNHSNFRNNPSIQTESNESIPSHAISNVPQSSVHQSPVPPHSKNSPTFAETNVSSGQQTPNSKAQRSDAPKPLAPKTSKRALSHQDDGQEASAPKKPRVPKNPHKDTSNTPTNTIIAPKAKRKYIKRKKLECPNNSPTEQTAKSPDNVPKDCEKTTRPTVINRCPKRAEESSQETCTEPLPNQTLSANDQDTGSTGNNNSNQKSIGNDNSQKEFRKPTNVINRSHKAGESSDGHSADSTPAQTQPVDGNERTDSRSCFSQREQFINSPQANNATNPPQPVHIPLKDFRRQTSLYVDQTSPPSQSTNSSIPRERLRDYPNTANASNPLVDGQPAAHRNAHSHIRKMLMKPPLVPPPPHHIHHPTHTKDPLLTSAAPQIHHINPHPAQMREFSMNPPRPPPPYTMHPNFPPTTHYSTMPPQQQGWFLRPNFLQTPSRPSPPYPNQNHPSNTLMRGEHPMHTYPHPMIAPNPLLTPPQSVDRQSSPLYRPMPYMPPPHPVYDPSIAVPMTPPSDDGINSNPAMLTASIGVYNHDVNRQYYLNEMEYPPGPTATSWGNTVPMSGVFQQ